MIINQGETVTGIVLKNKDYRDNDMLVWIYTREYGKMTLLARGAKKVSSKNAPACQTLTISEFLFVPKQGLSTLIKANINNCFRYLKEDIILDTYASYCLEFVYKFTGDNEPDALIYDTLLNALTALNNGYDYRLVYVLYNAFILKVCGSGLEVDHCVYCNKQSGIAGISIHGGGFVCQDCLGIYDRHLDVALLKGFRYINKFDFEYLDQLQLEDDIINELMTIMEMFIDEYSGIVFQSRKFIQQLKDIV